MKKLLVISVVILAFSSAAIGQVEEEKPDSRHYIGAAAGTTGGIGVLYQFKPNRFSVQAVAFPNVTKNNTLFMGGLNFHYDLKSYKHFDLYAFENNRIIYQSQTWNSGSTIRRRETRLLAHGVGLGLRFSPFEHFGFTFNSGFGAYSYETYTLSFDAALYFKL